MFFVHNFVSPIVYVLETGIVSMGACECAVWSHDDYEDDTNDSRQFFLWAKFYAFLIFMDENLKCFCVSADFCPSDFLAASCQSARQLSFEVWS